MMVEPRIAEVFARIRALREDLGFTAEEMAEATACNASEYAAIEGGMQDITLAFLHSCADKLGARQGWPRRETVAPAGAPYRPTRVHGVSQRSPASSSS